MNNRNNFSFFSLLIFILFTLSDCSSTKKSPKENQATQTSNSDILIRDISKFPDIQNQNNFSTLLNELEQEDCVNESGIGFAGEYTRTYALFERLKQIATEIQLTGLLRNSNPVVRVYAFRSLIDLKYESAGRAKLILDKDTTSVCWFSGCNKTKVPVNSFSKSEE